MDGTFLRLWCLNNEEIKAMKRMTIPARSQAEILKHMPSPLFRAAHYRSGAGVHADQKGRYTKRNRAKNRQEERYAMLHRGDTE